MHIAPGEVQIDWVAVHRGGTHPLEIVAVEQTAGEQATATKVLRFGLVEPIGRLGRCGFSRQVERFRRTQLHACGEFPGGNAGLEPGILRTLLGVDAVDFLQEFLRVPVRLTRGKRVLPVRK